MMNALDPLILAARKKISDADARIEAAQKQKAEGEIMLAAYTEAKRAVAECSPNAPNAPNAPNVGSSGGEIKTFGKLSDKWKKIFTYLFKNNEEEVGYRDVQVAVIALGYEAKISSIRSQMQTSARAGMFTRPSDGKFSFTPSLIATLGLQEDLHVISERVAVDEGRHQLPDFEPIMKLPGTP